MILEALQYLLIGGLLLIVFYEVYTRRKLTHLYKTKETDFNSAFNQIPSIGSPFIELTRSFFSLRHLKTRSYELIEKPHRRILSLSEVYQQLGMIQGYTFGLRAVNITNPECARELLFGKDTTWVKLQIGELTKKFIAESILVVKGDRWKTQKKILNPAFHWDHIKDLVPEINTVSRLLVKKLAPHTNETISIYPWMHDATMDMIGAAGFGHDFRSLEEDKDSKSPELKNYEELMKELSRPIHFFPRAAKFIGATKKSDETLTKFVKWMVSLIDEKRKKFEENPDRPATDILDLLVRAHDSKENKEENELLSEAEMIHNMNTFFIAGHETTSSGISSTIHQLADHPDIQEQCFQEIMNICGFEEPTNENLNQLTLLNNCVFETLRLYPPAPAIARLADEDSEIGGYHIPKGTFCSVNIYSIQRHPKYFEDPDSFIPDRFLPGKSKHHPYTFLPFSMGPRQCIGNKFAMMEMKVVLTHILQNFVIERVPEAPFVPHLGTSLLPSSSRVILRSRRSL